MKALTKHEKKRHRFFCPPTSRFGSRAGSAGFYGSTCISANNTQIIMIVSAYESSYHAQQKAVRCWKTKPAILDPDPDQYDLTDLPVSQYIQHWFACIMWQMITLVKARKICNKTEEIQTAVLDPDPEYRIFGKMLISPEPLDGLQIRFRQCEAGKISHKMAYFSKFYL